MQQHIVVTGGPNNFPSYGESTFTDMQHSLRVNLIPGLELPIKVAGNKHLVYAYTLDHSHTVTIAGVTLPLLGWVTAQEVWGGSAEGAHYEVQPDEIMYLLIPARAGEYTQGVALFSDEMTARRKDDQEINLEGLLYNGQEVIPFSTIDVVLEAMKTEKLEFIITLNLN